MSDLTLYPIHYDAVRATAEIVEAIDVCVDELSAEFQEIVRGQILVNGNGSGIMKAEAVKHVKELHRSVSSKKVELEVGVDEDEAGDVQARIRTVVVLHGNLAGGALFTKPGVATWKKHVVGPSESNAKTSYRLADFEQTDVTAMIKENAMKEVRQYIDQFLTAVAEAIATIDFSQFLY